MLKHAKTQAQSFRDIHLFLLLPRYISHREMASRLDAEREGECIRNILIVCVFVHMCAQVNA